MMIIIMMIIISIMIIAIIRPTISMVFIIFNGGVP